LGAYRNLARRPAIVYGGIHFRTAIELGIEQGRCIGREVSKLRFRDRE
jgi:hypothetical protein